MIFIYTNAVKSKFSYAYPQEFPYAANHIFECEFFLLENMDCCLIVYQPYRYSIPMFNVYMIIIEFEINP